MVLQRGLILQRNNYLARHLDVRRRGRRDRPRRRDGAADARIYYGCMV